MKRAAGSGPTALTDSVSSLAARAFRVADYWRFSQLVFLTHRAQMVASAKADPALNPSWGQFDFNR
jgi:hypothetical protein